MLGLRVLSGVARFLEGSLLTRLYQGLKVILGVRSCYPRYLLQLLEEPGKRINHYVYSP